MKREQLRKLIRESIKDVLTTKSPADPQREKLKGLIKKVIKEVMQTKKDKKTDADDSYDPLDIKDRVRLEKDRPPGKPVEEILKTLEKAAKSVSDEAVVSWINKDFTIEVPGPQSFRIRVMPRWENNFDVEAWIKDNDRIKIIGLTLEQVVDFVKENFSDGEQSDVRKKEYFKAVDQTKDVTKGPKPDVDGAKGVKEYKPEEKTKDMTEREEDLPGAPMKKVDEPKPQRDHSGNQVKPPKHKLDKELVKRMPGKKK